MNNYLFKKVAWCVMDDSHIRCNLNLLDWLLNIQFNSKKKKSDSFFPNANKLLLIEEKYWLCEEEFDYAKQILQEYQKDLIQKYFSNRLVLYRFTRKSTEAEYFVCTLKDFLEHYECKTSFKGNEMYTTKEYENLGCWGGPLFEVTYKLTDFSIVYHKMYLIAQTYCLTLCKDPLNTNTIAYKSVESTKKVLDTKEIKVSNY